MTAGDERTTRLGIRKRQIHENVRDAFDKLKLKDRKMRTVVMSCGSNVEEWVVRAGKEVGRAPTKKVARRVAIVRACLDPKFTGDAPVDIPGTAHHAELTACGPPRVPNNDLDPKVLARLGNLASVLLESSGRDAVKSVSIDCKDRKTVQVRICREETLTFHSG